MDRDLLVDNKEVFPALDTPCLDVEGKELKEINDSVLSRSITGLALRLSICYMNFSQPFIVF